MPSGACLKSRSTPLFSLFYDLDSCLRHPSHWSRISNRAVFNGLMRQALGPAPRDGFRSPRAGMTCGGGWGSGGKRKPRSTSAYGRPGGQPGSFGARRLHGFRKRNPGGRPLRVKPFTLQTPHQSVYHQYPIDHLLSECTLNINAIAVRAQYWFAANFGCC